MTASASDWRTAKAGCGGAAASGARSGIGGGATAAAGSAGAGFGGASAGTPFLISGQSSMRLNVTFGAGSSGSWVTT